MLASYDNYSGQNMCRHVHSTCRAHASQHAWNRSCKHKQVLRVNFWTRQRNNNNIANVHNMCTQEKNGVLCVHMNEVQCTYVLNKSLCHFLGSRYPWEKQGLWHT